MSTGALEHILDEIGESIGVSLQANDNNTCYVSIPGGCDIQMEILEDGENFLLIAEIGSIPLGKYREDIFKESLRFNGMPQPQVGFFAYSETDDTLNLLEIFPLKGLTGNRVSEIIPAFTNKAMVWKEAIQRGEIPQMTAETLSAAASQAGQAADKAKSIFDLESLGLDKLKGK